MLGTIISGTNCDRDQLIFSVERGGQWGISQRAKWINDLKKQWSSLQNLSICTMPKYGSTQGVTVTHRTFFPVMFDTNFKHVKS